MAAMRLMRNMLKYHLIFLYDVMETSDNNHAFDHFAI